MFQLVLTFQSLSPAECLMIYCWWIILTLFRRHGGSLTVAGKEKNLYIEMQESSRQNVEKLAAQLKVLGEYIGQSAENKIKKLTINFIYKVFSKNCYFISKY